MYRQLAPWYDTIAGFDDPQQACQELHEIFQHYECSPPGPLADFGAGTATNAIELAKLGWSVLCIERSIDMIRMGRQKIRKQIPRVQSRIEWLTADITRFSLPEQRPLLSGAVCLCNTINHLLDLEQLIGLASSCHKALEPGGLWLVDSDVVETFQLYFQHPEVLVYQNTGTSVYRTSDFNEQTGRVTHMARLVSPGQSSEELLNLQYHSPEVLQAVFEQAGFTVLEVRPYNPFPQRYAKITVSPKQLWVLQQY